MRCEDFPCCGHYEQSTGEIFCREANLTPAERRRDAAIQAAEDAYQAEVRRENRRAEYEAAPDEHNEPICEGYLGPCSVCEFDFTMEPNPCKECLEENEYNEIEAMAYAEDHY